MNAEDILQLLAQRHADDVFVPECKDGPTQTGTHRRLDAWAMKKSWKHPAFHAYEIKVHRSDWLRDQKLGDYLPLCTDLWVVAPKAVVLLDELPSEVGLLEAAGTGTRLLTRRKAVHRQIEPPISLLLYILMCRSRISRYDGAEDPRERSAQRLAELLEWIKEKEERRRIGLSVAAELDQRIKTRTSALLAEKQAAERRADGLGAAAGLLSQLGIDPTMSAWAIRNRLREALDSGLLETLHGARLALEAAERAIAVPPAANEDDSGLSREETP